MLSSHSPTSAGELPTKKKQFPTNKQVSNKQTNKQTNWSVLRMARLTTLLTITCCATRTSVISFVTIRHVQLLCAVLLNWLTRGHHGCSRICALVINFPSPPLTHGSTLCTTPAATFKVRDRQRAAHHEHANRYAGPHTQDHLAEQRGHCHQPGLRRDERDANQLAVPELECRDCVGQASDSKGHGGTGRLRSDWVCGVSSEHCWVPAVDTGLHVKRHSVRFIVCVFFCFFPFFCLA
jgi:hypothetical protein